MQFLKISTLSLCLFLLCCCSYNHDSEIQSLPLASSNTTQNDESQPTQENTLGPNEQNQMQNEGIDTNQLKAVSDVLQHLHFEAIDINTASFYSNQTSITYNVGELNPEQNYLLLEHHSFQGELLRYSQQANYTVTMRTNEQNAERQTINSFASKVYYQINNQMVQFSDDYGNTNYFTFAKEDAFLETVGQLEKIVEVFKGYEDHVELYPFDKKLYVNLTLPEDAFIENSSLLTETVFNGYFDTKTKAELLQEEDQVEEMNWPTSIFTNTISLILDENHKLESYYIAFDSDAYSRDESHRYKFTLMTSLFDVNSPIKKQ